MRKFATALLFTAALAIPALSSPTWAADQTQTFTTSKGTVAITPIYHATARITAGGDTIYIDPAKPAKIDGMGPGGLILITDIHGDHMDADDVKALSQCRHGGDRARRGGQDHHPGQAAGQWRQHDVARLEDHGGAHVQHQRTTSRAASPSTTRAAATAMC